LLGRALAITREVRADILLVSQSSSQNETCLVVPSSHAKLTVEELRREFAQDLAYEKVEHIAVDATVSIVTVVGQKIRGMSGVVGRAFCALSRANVDTIATAHGASQCKFSFVVTNKDMPAALAAMHEEFRLGALDSHGATGLDLGRRPCGVSQEFPISVSAD